MAVTGAVGTCMWGLDTLLGKIAVHIRRKELKGKKKNPEECIVHWLEIYEPGP